jgi:predicted anti-sigma-YlaC factor YlaD
MRCLDVQAELEAYVDGELGPERSALWEAHLARCQACQAELARLQAVAAALETWPLVMEPAQFTAQVMARVRPRPAQPRFRIRWSDLVISVAGAGLAAAAILLWRYLAPSGLAYLHPTQTYLRLELLQLDLLLLIQPLVRTNLVTWGLLLGGTTSLIVLTLTIWDLFIRRQDAFFM